MRKKYSFWGTVTNFLQTEAAGGVFMIFFAIIAILVANSGLSGWYDAFIGRVFVFEYDGKAASFTVKELVKDVLMVIFFFSVGMELKRDMSREVFENRRQILLPILAAAGGMICPALIYYAANFNYPENLRGWAIPAATDIAFAVAILLMAGSKLPRTARTFLLAVAIFDDLGAIIIIAFFYSGQIALVPMVWVLLGVLALYLLNRLNVPNKTPYVITGILLAALLHRAGIHTTIAGVLTGMFIPLSHPANKYRSPLKEMMDLIRPWVLFLVLPLFAFVSAGISLSGITMDSLFKPVTFGVAAGLFFGKQIGIFTVSFLLIHFKLLAIPKGSTLSNLYGVSIVAGIGFTMSLFVNMLAFTDINIQNQATLGIMIAFIMSTAWGCVYLQTIGARAAQGTRK